MRQSIKVPCVMMRGGTSRGPYFHAADLPEDEALRDALLISIMGSGHPLEIDGIGGGQAVTSKVAIVGPSTRQDADVDYLFAQVMVNDRRVDTSPNCGNMLSGVGPFAIEAGLFPASDGVTRLRIFNVNTGKIIEATVHTPGGKVTYAGATSISGVPGTAAPVHLAFVDAAGSKTGSLLPTGQVRNRFDGIEASCIDAAMPVVLMRASDLGKTGYESPDHFNADLKFLTRLDRIRLQAGEAMGLEDVRQRVIPKPVLLAPGRDGATVTARYFMPNECHPSLAITGSVAIASACCTPHTIAHEFCGDIELPATLTFAHPSGQLDVVAEPGQNGPKVSVVRTARRLFEGYVFGEPDIAPESDGKKREHAWATL